MRQLHPDVLKTFTNTTLKENAAFRVRLERWESVSPKGLYNLDMIQEILKDGEVVESSTYNFHMTKEEMKSFANALVS